MEQELINCLTDIKTSLESHLQQSKSASTGGSQEARKVVAAGIVKQASYARALAQYESLMGNF